MFMGSCANNLAALLADFLFYYRECLFHECERLEENSERRLEIFKELVNGYTKNPDEEEKFKDQSCSEQAGPLVFFIDFSPEAVLVFTNFYGVGSLIRIRQKDYFKDVF